ncbi:MAG: flagellar assembly protein FliW [Nitrospirae bacterium]|nr:MAG: flagellar assembly protein FliW [Nitrospirota bacterium]
MQLDTSRFGVLDIPEDSLLVFSSGLIGFSDYTKFVLLEGSAGLSYQWLQSVDDGNLAFVVVEPGLIKPNYEIRIQDDALREIAYQAGDTIGVLAIVTIPRGHPEKATVNLQGPLVLNVTKRKGKQIILNESYPLRYPLRSSQEEAVHNPAEPSPAAVHL